LFDFSKTAQSREVHDMKGNLVTGTANDSIIWRAYFQYDVYPLLTRTVLSLHVAKQHKHKYETEHTLPRLTDWLR